MIPNLDVRFIAMVLLIVAGVNWGLVAFREKDIFEIYHLEEAEIMGRKIKTIVYLLFCSASVYIALELTQGKVLSLPGQQELD